MAPSLGDSKKATRVETRMSLLGMRICKDNAALRKSMLHQLCSSTFENAYLSEDGPTSPLVVSRIATVHATISTENALSCTCPGERTFFREFQ